MRLPTCPVTVSSASGLGTRMRHPGSKDLSSLGKSTPQWVPVSLGASGYITPLLSNFVHESGPLPGLGGGSVLVMFSVAVIRPNQKQLGEDRVHATHIFTRSEQEPGGRNWRRSLGRGRQAAYRFAPRGLLSLLYSTQYHQPAAVQPTVSLDAPT